LLASSNSPTPRLSPYKYLGEHDGSVAPKCFDDMEELQNVEAALPLLIG
jgi:hypothetical protein